jgi:hypothetical protein
MNDVLDGLPELWIVILLIAGGGLTCFFGHRLFKIVLGIVGFLAGAMAGGGIALFVANGAEQVVLIVSVVAGICGALLLIWAFHVGVFIVGAAGGLIVGGALGASFTGWTQLVIVLILMVVGGILALKLQKVMLGISTAIVGAAMISFSGLVLILGSDGASDVAGRLGERQIGQEEWMLLGGWLLFTILGLGLQLSRGGKGEKKKKK